MPTTGNEQNRLSYARPGTSFPRSRLKFVLIIGAAIFAAILLRQYGPSLSSELRFLYLQRQWANCTIPAEKVVFDTGVKASSGRILGFEPPERLAFPAFEERSATIFLHAMRSPAGHERIVCVDVNGFDGTTRGRPYRSVVLLLWTYTPGSTPHWTGRESRWYTKFSADDHVEFFAGQPDPTDRTHFTIRYNHNGMPGTLDGHLQDDDSVMLVPDRGSGGGPDYGNGWYPTPTTNASSPVQ